MPSDKPHADVSFDDLATQALKNTERFMRETEHAVPGRDEDAFREERRHQELLATQYQQLALLERLTRSIEQMRDVFLADANTLIEQWMERES